MIGVTHDKKIEKGCIIFNTEQIEEVVKIANNGDFYVKGKKVATDIELYLGMKEWFDKYAKEDLKK